MDLAFSFGFWLAFICGTGLWCISTPRGTWREANRHMAFITLGSVVCGFVAHYIIPILGGTA